MPSKKPYIQIRTDDTTINKFSKMAKDECRSMSSLGEYIIKQHIKNYEAKHGPIKIEEEQS